MCALFGSDEPAVHAAPPLARYPSAEDAAFARKHGAFYGTAVDPYASGQVATVLNGSAQGASPSQVSDPRYARTGPLESFTGANIAGLPDVYARAGLAANRSAVAGLGFDPRRFSMEPNMDAENVNVGGVYSPEHDHGFVVPGASDDAASTVAHESMHRGLRILRDSGTFPPISEEFGDMKGSPFEEYMVRMLMQRYMGDPEQSQDATLLKRRSRDAISSQMPFPAGDKQIDEYLSKVEAAAAQEVARRKPGGPR